MIRMGLWSETKLIHQGTLDPLWVISLKGTFAEHGPPKKNPKLTLLAPLIY